MIYKAKMPEAWARNNKPAIYGHGSSEPYGIYANAIYGNRMKWCREAFGPPVKGGNWWRHRGHLYFRGEQNYTWFLLRWA